jgi:hypothetical protein
VTALTELQTIRRARVSSARMLRVYVGVATRELPDNGEPPAVKWGNVWRAAERLLAWRGTR